MTDGHPFLNQQEGVVDVFFGSKCFSVQFFASQLLQFE